MKRKYKFYPILDPIYRKHLSLFVGDWGKITEHLVSMGIPKDNFNGNPEGRFVPHENLSIIILTKYDLPTLVHEIIHYAFYVMYMSGVVIGYENDETITYYVEMTLKNILKALHKEK